MTTIMHGLSVKSIAPHVPTLPGREAGAGQGRIRNIFRCLVFFALRECQAVKRGAGGEGVAGWGGMHLREWCVGKVVSRVRTSGAKRR